MVDIRRSSLLLAMLFVVSMVAATVLDLRHGRALPLSERQVMLRNATNTPLGTLR